MDEIKEKNSTLTEEDQQSEDVSTTKNTDSSNQNLEPPSLNEKEEEPSLGKAKNEISNANSASSNSSANSLNPKKLNNDKKAIKNTPRKNRRKRSFNEEEEDNFEYGSPYVVLALNHGNPITCYMMSKEGEPQSNQYVATLPVNAPTVSLTNGNSLIVSNNQPMETPKKNTQIQPATPISILSELGLQKKKRIKMASDEPDPSPSKLNNSEGLIKLSPEKEVTKSSAIEESIPNSNKILVDTQQTSKSVVFPSLNSDNNQIQIMISPGGASDAKIPKILTKVPPPVISKGKVFPVRHVLPKTSEGVDFSQVEIQKILEEQIKTLKKELAKSIDEINEEKRNAALVKSLKEKLLNKRKQIKTMCTQRKRLIKRLDNCRDELEKTRKALELVESQAILWNNANMSDLGKLIFGLHTVKNKRSLDSKLAASRAPPEVKGFVISLYMTSPKAYQLVRDCFNGLPHPKTVSRWLHGDRIEESKPQFSKHTQLNDVTIEETFTRVLDKDEELEEQGSEMELLGDEVTITEKLIDETEIVENSPAIYYVLDEKGNVTGQLTGVSADMFLTADDLDPKLLPQHEVVINE